MGTRFVSTTSVTPSKGIVTWDSEGTEGGKYHSRKLHVPSDASGLTIGRGYDMKTKTKAGIVNDLTAAGVDEANAKKLSGAAGLQGAAARKFITDNNLAAFEITEAAQKALFEISYKAEAAEAKRLATKQDVVDKYGATDWSKLHPAIEQMLVDMKFRGDYDGRARTLVQPSVVANDLEKFAAVMMDAAKWPNVPKDRFNRRVAFLQDALKEHRAAAAAAAKKKMVVPPMLKRPESMTPVYQPFVVQLPTPLRP